MFLGLKKCERKTFWRSVSPSLCGLVAEHSKTVTHVTLVDTGIDFVQIPISYILLYFPPHIVDR